MRDPSPEHLYGGAVGHLSWKLVPVTDSICALKERVPVDESCTRCLFEEL